MKKIFLWLAMLPTTVWAISDKTTKALDTIEQQKEEKTTLLDAITTLSLDIPSMISDLEELISNPEVDLDDPEEIIEEVQIFEARLSKESQLMTQIEGIKAKLEKTQKKQKKILRQLGLLKTMSDINGVDIMIQAEQTAMVNYEQMKNSMDEKLEDLQRTQRRDKLQLEVLKAALAQETTIPI